MEKFVIQGGVAALGRDRRGRQQERGAADPRRLPAHRGGAGDRATCRGSATPRRSSRCSSGSGSRSSGAATTSVRLCADARRRRRGRRGGSRTGSAPPSCSPGPLLARFGEARMPPPGGDIIGRRRLDAAPRRLPRPRRQGRRRSLDRADGAAGRPAGHCAIFMDEPSVMGTENALMAAALTPGPTTIANAACEPHVQDLARLLTTMGAEVDGIGSNVMTVHGRDKLGGAEHTICARPHRGRQLHGARRGDRRRAADPRRRARRPA